MGNVFTDIVFAEGAMLAFGMPTQLVIAAESIGMLVALVAFHFVVGWADIWRLRDGNSHFRGPVV